MLSTRSARLSSAKKISTGSTSSSYGIAFLFIIALLTVLPWVMLPPLTDPTTIPTSVAAMRARAGLDGKSDGNTMDMNNAQKTTSKMSTAASTKTLVSEKKDEEIVIVYVLCGNPNEIEEDLFGLVSLKSLIMANAQLPMSATHHRYDIRLLTNILADELFNTTRLGYEVWRILQHEPRFRFTLHNINELDSSATFYGVKNPELVPHTIFKNCASSRLKLPFLLAKHNIKQAIYLDWDTVTLCDLSDLWFEFSKFKGEDTSFAFVQSDPTGVSNLDHYREWNSPRHPTAGSVNSGVMLIDAANVLRMKEKYWKAVETILYSRVNVTPGMTGEEKYWAFTRKFPLGDQDILNTLLQQIPEILHVLPPRFNFCLEWDFPENLPEHVTPEGREAARARYYMPCVIHFCGAKLLPTVEGEMTLPITNPWKAAHMFVMHWPLQPYVDKPPGRNLPQEDQSVVR
jgi:lipopolysaccharide biosynthesis glycosyltransferase